MIPSLWCRWAGLTESNNMPSVFNTNTRAKYPMRCLMVTFFHMLIRTVRGVAQGIAWCSPVFWAMTYLGLSNISDNLNRSSWQHDHPNWAITNVIPYNSSAWDDSSKVIQGIAFRVGCESWPENCWIWHVVLNRIGNSICIQPKRIVSSDIQETMVGNRSEYLVHHSADSLLLHPKLLHPKLLIYLLSRQNQVFFWLHSLTSRPVMCNVGNYVLSHKTTVLASTLKKPSSFNLLDFQHVALNCANFPEPTYPVGDVPSQSPLFRVQRTILFPITNYQRYTSSKPSAQVRRIWS